MEDASPEYSPAHTANTVQDPVGNQQAQELLAHGETHVLCSGPGVASDNTESTSASASAKTMGDANSGVGQGVSDVAQRSTPTNALPGSVGALPGRGLVKDKDKSPTISAGAGAAEWKASEAEWGDDDDFGDFVDVEARPKATLTHSSASEAVDEGGNSLFVGQEGGERAVAVADTVPSSRHQVAEKGQQEVGNAPSDQVAHIPVTTPHTGMPTGFATGAVDGVKRSVWSSSLTQVQHLNSDGDAEKHETDASGHESAFQKYIDIVKLKQQLYSLIGCRVEASSANDGDEKPGAQEDVDGDKGSSDPHGCNLHEDVLSVAMEALSFKRLDGYVSTQGLEMVVANGSGSGKRLRIPRQQLAVLPSLSALFSNEETGQLKEAVDNLAHPDMEEEQYDQQSQCLEQVCEAGVLATPPEEESNEAMRTNKINALISEIRALHTQQPTKEQNEKQEEQSMLWVTHPLLSPPHIGGGVENATSLRLPL
ncbi:hypothetical protein ERJ75_001333600 [Trypanosoma vivax]|nr:hypothetical protein ERJ75_001333600 [Trypanosoma vivax]